MIKQLITLGIIFLGLLSFGQKDINNYKYVLVPKSFDFTKGEDQYQLNSITKFLFNKYGFEAYFVGDEYPEDLLRNRCLAMEVAVSDVKGGFLKTKLEIALVDCFGNTIITSEVGESKLKKFEKAYNEALRDAFTTYKYINYEYKPSENKDQIVESKPVAEKQEKTEVKKESAVNNMIKDVIMETKHKTTLNSETLYYAQVIDNGYQLIDSEPKIIMVLLKTASPDIFMVKDKNAMVIKKEGKWIYSENSENELIEKELKIKF